MPCKVKFKKNGVFDIKIDFEKEHIFDGEVPAKKIDELFNSIRRKFG